MTPVGTLARVARGHVARAVAGTVVAIAMVAGMSPVGQAGAEPIVAQATTATPGITVTGESTVTVAPDVAYLTVGVQTSARTAREASATNATQVAAVIEAVTRAGIPSSAIRTVGLSLRPTYAPRNQPDNRPPTIAGYEATNQVVVRPMASDAISPRVMAAPGLAAEMQVSPVSPGELSYRGHVRVTFAIGG